mmetsp:Transcript_18178/g.32554  ORF Transcript_18178/g.32554 Transcript_18178/m.32554 type:complete len:739 (-) Transcript_18178:215-2431(-)
MGGICVRERDKPSARGRTRKNLQHHYEESDMQEHTESEQEESADDSLVTVVPANSPIPFATEKNLYTKPSPSTDDVTGMKNKNTSRPLPVNTSNNDDEEKLRADAPDRKLDAPVSECEDITRSNSFRASRPASPIFTGRKGPNGGDPGNHITLGQRIHTPKLSPIQSSNAHQNQISESGKDEGDSNTLNAPSQNTKRHSYYGSSVSSSSVTRGTDADGKSKSNIVADNSVTKTEQKQEVDLDQQAGPVMSNEKTSKKSAAEDDKRESQASMPNKPWEPGKPTDEQVEAWKVTDDVYVHFSQLGWRRGVIQRIFKDDEGEWLVVKDYLTEAVKEVDRFDNEIIRPFSPTEQNLSEEMPTQAQSTETKASEVQNKSEQKVRFKEYPVDVLIREAWKIGDPVEVFFSRYGWVEAKIWKMNFDSEGEWLEVVDRGERMKKKVKRMNEYEIRPPSELCRIFGTIVGPNIERSCLRIKHKGKVLCKTIEVGNAKNYPPLYVKRPIMFHKGYPVMVQILDCTDMSTFAEREFKSSEEFFEACESGTAIDLINSRISDYDSIFESIRLKLQLEQHKKETHLNQISDDPQLDFLSELKSLRTSNASAASLSSSTAPENTNIIGPILKISGKMGTTQRRWLLINDDGVFYSKKESIVRNDKLVNHLVHKMKRDDVLEINGLRIIPYKYIKKLEMIGSKTFKLFTNKKMRRKSKFMFRADSDDVAMQWYQRVGERLRAYKSDSTRRERI